jgi:hypothetical protein
MASTECYKFDCSEVAEVPPNTQVRSCTQVSQEWEWDDEDPRWYCRKHGNLKALDEQRIEEFRKLGEAANLAYNYKDWRNIAAHRKALQNVRDKLTLAQITLFRQQLLDGGDKTTHHFAQCAVSLYDTQCSIMCTEQMIEMAESIPESYQ